MRTRVTRPSRPASTKELVKKAGRDALVILVRIYDRGIIKNKRHLNLNVQSPLRFPRQRLPNKIDIKL